VTWFRVDDGFHDHDKLDDLGAEAIALWALVGSSISGRNTDGVISARTVKDMAHRADLADREEAIARLVAAGLWHRSVSRCEECRHVLETKGVRLAKGEFYMHDYLQWNKASEEKLNPDVKWKEARKKRLYNDKEKCARIKERDRWCCRYCQRRVRFDDHRTDAGGTYDHVDPADRENTYDLVVVACRACNIAKGDRTPSEAGMKLATVAEHLAIIETRIDPGSNPGADRNSIPAEADPPPACESGRDGSELDPGSDPGVEPDEGEDS
jgi:5-methylcytosine-specific restriction endonuclease McrA